MVHARNIFSLSFNVPLDGCSCVRAEGTVGGVSAILDLGSKFLETHWLSVIIEVLGCGWSGIWNFCSGIVGAHSEGCCCVGNGLVDFGDPEVLDLGSKFVKTHSNGCSCVVIRVLECGSSGILDFCSGIVGAHSDGCCCVGCGFVDFGDPEVSDFRSKFVEARSNVGFRLFFSRSGELFVGVTGLSVWVSLTRKCC